MGDNSAVQRCDFQLLLEMTIMELFKNFSEISTTLSVVFFTEVVFTV